MQSTKREPWSVKGISKSESDTNTSILLNKPWRTGCDMLQECHASKYSCSFTSPPIPDEQPHGAPESAGWNCQADIGRTHLGGSDRVRWGLVSIRINAGCRRKGLRCQTLGHQLNSYSNLCLPFLLPGQNLAFRFELVKWKLEKTKKSFVPIYVQSFELYLKDLNLSLMGWNCRVMIGVN